MNYRKLMTVLLLVMLPVVVFSQTTTTGNQRQARTFVVDVESNIANADVYVDGSLQRQRTPTTLNLRSGTYEIRVVADGYRPFIQTITVTSNMTIRAELVRPFATVRLEVPREYLNFDVRNPESQILFYVDDQLRREPEFQVRSGVRRIAIVSGGLRFEGDIYFEPGMVYTLELILRLNLMQSINFRER